MFFGPDTRPILGILLTGDREDNDMHYLCTLCTGDYLEPFNAVILILQKRQTPSLACHVYQMPLEKELNNDKHKNRKCRKEDMHALSVLQRRYFSVGKDSTSNVVGQAAEDLQSYSVELLLILHRLRVSGVPW